MTKRDRLSTGLLPWYVVAGGVLMGTFLLTSPARRLWMYMLFAVLVVTAVITGIRRYRPTWTRPWWLLVAAVGMSVVASLAWVLTRTATGVPESPSPGDFFYVASTGLLTASVYWWVRPGRYRGGVLDAAIALTGGGAIVWVAAAEPLLFNGRFAGFRLFVYLLYIGNHLLILALTVRVVVVSRVRTVAYRLMVAAATLWVTTGIIYYATVFRGLPEPGAWLQAGWLTAYLMIGAAALHPSMSRSTGTMPRNAVLLTRTRLVAYVALTVLIAGLGAGRVAVAAPAGQGGRMIVVLFLGCITSVLLIGRLAQLGAALDEQAHVDVLTGLGNRVVLRAELHRRAAHDRALMVLDLTGFREINAAFGHRAGDAVLIESGHRLRAAAPSAAVVVRLEADAFAVLTHGGQDELHLVSGRLLAAVAEPYAVPELTSRRVQAAVGAVIIPAGADGTTALRDAEIALQKARTQGDGLAVFDPGEYAQWRANRDLIAELQQAIGAGELSMHYQPIVDLADGRIVAAEALLRWTRSDGTPISPARFVPLAEQSGDILVIGDWVLGQVCADLVALWAAYRLPVTVNVSAYQLRDSGFAARLLDRLRSADLSGQALIVEITETVLVTTVTDAATTIGQLQQLREQGVRIAIDDFGTGYSSLAYLRELPVDILKMDGSFTSQQIEDGGPREIAFVRTIVDLGCSLDLRTLAEAVETEAQARRLRELGCHLAQGYHFARPAPIGRLHELLAAQRSPSADAVA